MEREHTEMHLSPAARRMIAEAVTREKLRRSHPENVELGSETVPNQRVPLSEHNMHEHPAEPSKPKYSWQLPEPMVKEYGEARRHAERLRGEWQRARELHSSGRSARAARETPVQTQPGDEPKESGWGSPEWWARMAQSAQSHNALHPQAGPPYEVTAQQQWEQFVTESRARGRIHIADIPFPTELELELETKSSRFNERLFKQLALRWHPDKFNQKFGAQLAAHECELILTRVKEVFQWIQRYRS